MKVYKVTQNAQIPEFATEGSACFDIRACFEADTKVVSYNPHNKEMQLPVKTNASGVRTFQIPPQFRVLIPTGLIFNVPKGHVLKFYIRSSMALKFGLNLANDVAVIDSDYVDPAYVMIYNMGDTPITLSDGDRIAQGSLEKLTTYKLEETTVKPKQKTDRTGGLGSTGVQ